MVPCRRSTKPLVQVCRGWDAGEADPRSAVGEPSADGQPAARQTSKTRVVRKRVPPLAEGSVLTRAMAYEQATSQAVYCQTFPSSLSFPMEKVPRQTSSPGSSTATSRDHDAGRGPELDASAQSAAQRSACCAGERSPAGARAVAAEHARSPGVFTGPIPAPRIKDHTQAGRMTKSD
jgi:hypothetical protein